MTDITAQICSRFDAALQAASHTLEICPSLSVDSEVWVSSDLRWIVPQPIDYIHRTNRDGIKSDELRCVWAEDFGTMSEDGRWRNYRRLGADWYVWLRSRMLRARRAATDGVLDPHCLEALESRWSVIESWILAKHGEQKIHRALTRSIPLTYAPPEVQPPSHLQQRMEANRC